MPEYKQINKNRQLPEGADFYALRNKGMEAIEQLGADFYTDYNDSDPGVAICETICYVFTELAHRTSFLMKDIVTDKPGVPKANQAFFTARNIMTTNPVTINDFRKVIIDIDGIRNAWINPDAEQEINFWADCNKNRLKYYENEIKFEKYSPKKIEEVWRHILAQENDSVTQFKVWESLTYTSSGSYQRTEIEFAFPGWSFIQENFDAFKPFLNLPDFENDVMLISLDNDSYNDGSDYWQSDIKIEFTSKAVSKMIKLTAVSAKPVKNQDELDLVKTLLTDKSKGGILHRYQDYLYMTMARQFFHDVLIKGLYDILIDLDNDQEHGDLNTEIMFYELSYKDGDNWQVRELEVIFPEWREIIASTSESDQFIHAGQLTDIAFSNDFYDVNESKWMTDLDVTFDSEGSSHVFTISNVEFNNVLAADLPALKNEVVQINPTALISLFHNKLKRINEIVDAVSFKLHSKRNLCEDYRNIEGVRTEEIGICADISIANDAEMEYVMAQVYYAIESYFSPEIRFYSLMELEKKNLPTEEIFEGPALDHGFIPDHELEEAELRKKIFVSDLVNLIMDIKGVLDVKNILLTKYDDRGRPIKPSAKWCMYIRPKHKPKLVLSKSKILIFKDGYPFIPSPQQAKEIHKRFENLLIENRKPKLKSDQNDYPVPQGNYLHLEQYSPLRILFPQNFGVSGAGMPESATEERKAKAKQLKAYLLFFDQILAGYLSQVAHIKELYALNPSEEKTYYDHFLDDNHTGEDLYVDAVKLKDTLHSMLETTELYHDRRNRFLDNLLARFNEQFKEYTFLINSLEGAKSPQILIDDKASFLEDYPEISAGRGKAFNYKDNNEIWDTENVAGLKKRISRLLGIEDFSRKYLHCPTVRDTFQIENIAAEGDPEKYQFRLDVEGTTKIISTDIYETEEDAYNAKEDLIMIIDNAESYSYPGEGESGHFIIVKNGIPLAESKESFPTRNDAIQAGMEIIKMFEKDFDAMCDLEGFHLIEYLLLRPTQKGDEFLGVCLDEDCEICGEENPYSFRIAYIFPYWPQRFTDNQIAFRQYVEKLIRLETPAHILPRICWVNNKHMRAFEIAYQRWLKENSRKFPDTVILQGRKNRLVRILKTLFSIYPEARLHDCSGGEAGSVKLDHSILGTLKYNDDGNDHPA